MTIFSDRVLFWAPRAVAILFIVFVSLFALEVFREGYGFWKTAIRLVIYLRLSFVMMAALIVAWRWEWVGAIAFPLFAAFFALIGRGPWVKVTFAAPCLMVAWLFFVNWRRKRRPATVNGPPRPAGC